MELIINDTLKDDFLTGLTRQYSSQRTGIHVSDLVLCLREAYFRKVDPKPHTEKTLSYFTDGASRHLALQGLSTYKREVKIERWGVIGSADLLANTVIEYKSTRAQNAIPDHYTRQLGYYVCMFGKDYGFLIVQRLLGETPWEFYKVQYSRPELEFFSREIQKKARILRSALENHNPLLVPGTDEKWKCGNCLWRDDCSAL